MLPVFTESPLGNESIRHSIILPFRAVSRLVTTHSELRISLWTFPYILGTEAIRTPTQKFRGLHFSAVGDCLHVRKPFPPRPEEALCCADKRLFTDVMLQERRTRDVADTKFVEGFLRFKWLNLRCQKNAYNFMKLNFRCNRRISVCSR
jgi:hypothetical protein